MNTRTSWLSFRNRLYKEICYRNEGLEIGQGCNKTSSSKSMDDGVIVFIKGQALVA